LTQEKRDRVGMSLDQIFFYRNIISSERWKFLIENWRLLEHADFASFRFLSPLFSHWINQKPIYKEEFSPIQTSQNDFATFRIWVGHAQFVLPGWLRNI
jgi:hypothetical protein